MDQPRHSLLPGPRGARDQDAGIGARQLGDHLAQLLSRHRLSGHPLRRDRLGAKPPVLPAQARGLEGAFDQQQQPVGLERLFEELVGAALDGGHGGLDVAVAADHDHRQVAVEALDQIQQLQPVHAAAGHPYVQDQQRGLACADGGQRALRVVGGPDRVAFVGEDSRHQVADVGLVVDHQNVSSHLQVLMPSQVQFSPPA